MLALTTDVYSALIVQQGRQARLADVRYPALRRHPESIACPLRRTEGAGTRNRKANASEALLKFIILKSVGRGGTPNSPSSPELGWLSNVADHRTELSQDQLNQPCWRSSSGLD